MAEGAVVFVRSVACPKCGLRSSAYLSIVSQTEGAAICPRCGAGFRHPLPQHHVLQVPPAGLTDHRGRGRVTRYPGLYSRPKEAPRFDLGGLMRTAALPSDGFQRLFVRTDFGHAMIVVIMTALVGSIVAGLVSWTLLDELGYYTSNNLWLVVSESMSFSIQIVTFFVFSFSAALISKWMFKGRGDYSATATLMGYAMVWYTAISVSMSVVFATVFMDAISRDDPTVTASVIALGLLFVVLIVGLIWLLWVSARAVSVANDISLGEGVLTIIISSLIVGAVTIAVSLFVTLPIGISL